MSAREKILDAATSVMRERGLGSATTKEIAKAAGYSEATLYKHFSDQQEIFLGVLSERMPPLELPHALIGRRRVENNLERIVVRLLRFYVSAFPIAASVFSTPELLAAQRHGMRARNAGPDHPIRNVLTYLEGERALGRIASSGDLLAIAQLLAGASMQQAFLANFAGLTEVPQIRSLAKRLVSAVTPALEIPS